MRNCSALLKVFLVLHVYCGTLAIPDIAGAQYNQFRFMVKPKYVDYVKLKLKVENPEEVAKIVFRETSTGEDEKPVLSSTRFVKEELGDGTYSYVFSPPGGQGSYGYHPEYHFVVKDGKAIMLFDSDGRSSEYVELYKINNRYPIMCSWRFMPNSDKVTYARAAELWFWDGQSYIIAYTDHISTKSDGTRSEKREYVKSNKQMYLSGRREYETRKYDTLMSIALRFYGQASEWQRIFDINRQKINDPDRITVGMVLEIPFPLK